LLETNAALVLEGLDVQVTGPALPRGRLAAAVLCRNAPLRVANCRFTMRPGYLVLHGGSPLLDVRNCLILDGHSGVEWECPPGGQLLLDNCVVVQLGHALVFHSFQADMADAVVRLTRNVLSADVPVAFSLNMMADAWASQPQPGLRPIRVEADGNIVDGKTAALKFNQSAPENGKLPPPADADQLLPHLLAWRDRGNLYPATTHLLQLSQRWRAPTIPAARAGNTVAAWQQFWRSPDAGNLQGRVRYETDGLFSRAVQMPGHIEAEDFRLHSESPGYRAGNDGRDLGPDVELVGPGSGYESWKETTAYQQWLKDTRTGQGR
jgi:hypothetical protein